MSRKRVFGIYDYVRNDWWTSVASEGKKIRFDTIQEANQFLGEVSDSGVRPYYITKKPSKKDAVIEAARAYIKHSGRFCQRDDKDYELYCALAKAFRELDETK